MNSLLSQMYANEWHTVTDNNLSLFPQDRLLLQILYEMHAHSHTWSFVLSFMDYYELNSKHSYFARELSAHPLSHFAS
jgi:hypothetical protein